MKLSLILLLLTALLALSLPASAAGKKSALAEVEAENRVRRAFWEQNQYELQLHVLVNGDGSDRTGYAQYLCLLLSDHGLSGVHVIIYDYHGYLNKKQRGIRHRLGECHCP